MLSLMLGFKGRYLGSNDRVGCYGRNSHCGCIQHTSTTLEYTYSQDTTVSSDPALADQYLDLIEHSVIPLVKQKIRIMNDANLDSSEVHSEVYSLVTVVGQDHMSTMLWDACQVVSGGTRRILIETSFTMELLLLHPTIAQHSISTPVPEYHLNRMMTSSRHYV